MSIFERYLTVWVFFCIVIGIPDGHFKFLHPWPGQNPPLDSVVIA
jgi:ACR3 family arsenite efflux pump ArsB